jgi:membrane fusion protein (multidrug efflux system)
MELQGSYRIAVVDANNKVEIRPVKVAERVDDMWVIDEGLKAGERVVAEGVQKVRDGITVNPTPYGSIPQSTTDQAKKAEATPPAQPQAEKR